MDIVIAGGGVAGLEGLLALHAIAGDSVRLSLVAPDPEFSYRSLAVAEPFALGHAHRVPLSRFAEETSAELVIDAVVEVGDGGGRSDCATAVCLASRALLLAPGGRAAAGLEGATTWWPGGDSEEFRGLLRDIDEGYTKRLAIVVPPGAVWPLPAYELALMTAGEARRVGHDDVQVIIVTPERGPLSLFGQEAATAVSEELRWAGVELRTGVMARAVPGGLLLEPGGERLDVQRVFSVPRVLGPGIEGVPTDEQGFIRAGDDARVEGCERTWAAGDGVVSPVKFGGLATHQARRAASAIARLTGVEDAPDPGEAVLHGRLLVGHRSRRLRGRGDAEGAPLWWPQGKVAGEYLPRWLAEHGVAPPVSHAPPKGGGHRSSGAERDARRGAARRGAARRGAEAQYLFDLVRQFDSADPAIAPLGRRMLDTRDR